MSYGEQIALLGQVELETVDSTDPRDARGAADGRFLDLLKSGDLVAFDKLVTERTGDIFALLFRLTGDAEEAKDLTQETFLRAFQSIAGFRGEADLKTWLYRIAVNQARNRWRWWKRRRRDATLSIDCEQMGAIGRALWASDRTNPEVQTAARERETTLRNALQSLKSAYREAVILRDIEGLSYEEIAAALEITVGTVKSRLSRGREDLRKRLGDSFR